MPDSLTLSGILLCFVATTLLVVVCVSAPIWDSVSFLNVMPLNGQTIHFGVFGFTGSRISIGYRIDSVNVGFADTAVESATLYHLTKMLILHPVAAGLAGLSVLFGICGAVYHRAGTVLMSLLAATAALTTLIAFVADMVLFGIVRDRYWGKGAHAQYSNANWLTLCALVALGLGFCGSTCGIFGSYRGRKGVQ